jgi:hypothetical protein
MHLSFVRSRLRRGWLLQTITLLHISSNLNPSRANRYVVWKYCVPATPVISLIRCSQGWFKDHSSLQQLYLTLRVLLPRIIIFSSLWLDSWRTYAWETPLAQSYYENKPVKMPLTKLLSSLEIHSHLRSIESIPNIWLTTVIESWHWEV